jgi:hypothetical protein
MISGAVYFFSAVLGFFKVGFDNCYPDHRPSQEPDSPFCCAGRKNTVAGIRFSAAHPCRPSAVATLELERKRRGETPLSAFPRGGQRRENQKEGFPEGLAFSANRVQGGEFRQIWMRGV